MPKLTIGKRSVPLPIVQGGMGVGISLSGLAASVARQGGIGVIAANGIGMIEPDYFADGRAANIRAMRSELRKAREKTHGLIGVNIMVAANDFQQLLDTCIEEKADILFMGAGLPIKNMPVARIRAAGVLVAPIVSSSRAAELIFKYWQKTYGDVPDAVVVEGPLAGGHLGFKADRLRDADQQLEVLVPQVVAALAPFGEAFQKRIPVIAAGGIFTGGDILRFLQLGAQGVQMATRFVATDECDADRRFKEAYVSCRPEDIVIIKSPVGLPGRAIRNRFLDSAAAGVRNVKRCAWRCLEQCDIQHADYCISIALDNARRGELDQGFAFCGANAHRVDRIVPVAELLGGLKHEYEAAFVQSLVTLKDEYIRTIERKFAGLQQDYLQARQRFVLLTVEAGKAWDIRKDSLREDYARAQAMFENLKAEYEAALGKLNSLKERFPEKLTELQEIAQRFQADPVPQPAR
ncbi:MAG: nitronate monooxygenase [Acidobacteriota bacterium]|nr:nitronate monooxygenase [Acidobacteriota bacterium]